MKKSIRLVLVSIICFFSILCFADTTTISVNQKDLILPNFEGFNILTNKNSDEFKKLDAQYSAHNNTITYAHYYEINPGKISRFINILGFNDTPDILTKKQWSEIKNQIYEDSQKPTENEENNTKAIRTVIESVTNKDLYNIYISESKIYQKASNKFQHAFTNLDAKTFLYLNGKMLVITVTIEGDNAYNVSTLQWIKTISESAAEKIIQQNPPTEKDLIEAKKAEQSNLLHNIKIALLIAIGLLALLWKLRYRFKPVKQ